MSDIELKPCPVCEKEFDNITDMIAHVKAHNRRDTEYDKSVVAEDNREKREFFG